MLKRLLIATNILLLIALAVIVYLKKWHKTYAPRDYSDIVQSDSVLRIGVDKDLLVLPDSLFRAVAMAQEFARDHRLKVEVKEGSAEKLNAYLQEGRIDLIASGLLKLMNRSDSLLLSDPVYTDYQVLVQRIPQTPPDSANLLNKPIELVGSTLHIKAGDSVTIRLRHLEKELGESFTIVSHREPYAKLMQKVSAGEIDNLICSHLLAKTYADSLKNLQFDIQISFDQFYCWAVNRRSPALLDSLNTWLQARRDADQDN